MRYRGLWGEEQEIGTKVFNSTINYSSVQLADDLGLGGKPWCSPPVPYFMPYFVLHVGADRYDEGMHSSSGRRGLLIHELTHVWQGMRNIPFWYVINSACFQTFSHVTTGSTDGAYDYPQDLQWAQYNAEQQASIVAGWYRDGMLPGDWRYRYIHSNIRAGNPFATSEPVPSSFPVFQLQRTAFSFFSR